MPPTRQNTKQIQQPTARPPFNLPNSLHLLITTPRQIFAWDNSGLHSLFRSRRSSIVAAREAKDGSGVLAIASRNVIVLHDTKRGKDASWGLNANQEEVRHLEYSPDAKSLFLTTTIDGTIQRYDTESARLLDPAEKLATAPIALAMSPTGHLVLSASSNPPVVYLKNLTHNTVSTTLHPNVSTAPVSCAAFHPERPNVFLLAFRDGTVAAYDATKMPKTGPDQSSARDGEISHIQSLHRVVVTGDSSLEKSTLAAPIAGAAFLPGYKTRAVTAGRDGKCKIVDFANQGVVLRSWHAKAPLTTISVTAVRLESRRSSRGSRNSQASASHTIGGPTTTDSLIALGRIDGKVHIYDTVGLLLAQKAVSASEEKIISVEWAKGNTPDHINLADVERHFSDSETATLTSIARKTSAQVQAGPTPKKPSVSVQGGPKDASFIRSDTRALPITSPPTRKFTVHPDELNEVEDGTVRHNPSPRRSRPAAPAAAGYDDLFSPVKTDTATPERSPRKRIISPGRNRPRLSSQTFIKSPDAQLDPTKAKVDMPRAALLSPTIEDHVTSSGSAEKRKQNAPTIPRKSSRRMNPRVSPRSTHPISFTQPTFHVGDGTESRNSTAGHKSNLNAKVLSDIRKLNGNHTTSQNGYGILSAYAGLRTIGHAVEPQIPAPSTEHPPAKSPHVKKRSVHLSDSETWPTDSAASIGANDDIWLTSDSETGTNKQRKRRDPRLSRPLARQTSRSKVNGLGTISKSTMSPPASRQLPHHEPQIDGSTEENMLSADTHMSPAVRFSPASEDLRELFPRSSSLAPNKGRSSKKKEVIASTKRRGLGVTAMALNQALSRPTKSPCAQVKAGKRVASPRQTSQAARYHRLLPDEGDRQVAIVGGGLMRSPSLQCLVCPDTAARVRALENEVTLMKGEILAMKALLRRNGLPFLACLR